MRVRVMQSGCVLGYTLTLHPSVDPTAGSGWEGSTTLVALGAVVVIGSVTAGTGSPLQGTATLHTLLGHLGVQLSTLHTLSGGHKVS